MCLFSDIPKIPLRIAILFIFPQCFYAMAVHKVYNWMHIFIYDIFNIFILSNTNIYIYSLGVTYTDFFYIFFIFLPGNSVMEGFVGFRHSSSKSDSLEEVAVVWTSTIFKILDMFYLHRSAFMLDIWCTYVENMTKLEWVGCNIQAFCTCADSNIQPLHNKTVFSDLFDTVHRQVYQ